jgi:hypothetical protein
MSESIRDIAKGITNRVENSNIIEGLRSRLEDKGLIRKNVSELDLTSSDRAEIFYRELGRRAEERHCTEMELPMRVMDRTARRWGFKDAIDASRTYEWILQHQRNMGEFSSES